MERIKSQTGFHNMFVVDCVGRNGGLALLWNEKVGLEIQNFSQRHINATIKPVHSGVPWKMTGFYGHPKAHKRHEAWGLLCI